jgi:phosphoribosylpyrophosphate synthetase
MKKLTIRIPQDRQPAGAGLYSVVRYPAGEIQIRLTGLGLRACKGKDAYEIICNPIPDIIELAQLKDALDGAGQIGGGSQWYERHLFLPYMPYARADRRFVPGDSFGLKVWTKLVSSLGFSSIWTFDAHSPVAQRLFAQHAQVAGGGLANMLPTDAPIDQLAPIIRKLGRKGLVLVLPDEGALKRYDLDKYGLPTVVGTKHRDARTGKLDGFGVLKCHRDFVDVAMRALIVDDICDGGGTFIGLAEALLKINPDLKLYLYVSHGIFSKGQAGLLGYFDDIFTSQYDFNAKEKARLEGRLGGEI